MFIHAEIVHVYNRVKSTVYGHAINELELFIYYPTILYI